MKLGVAILKPSGVGRGEPRPQRIRSSVVASQINLHQRLAQRRPRRSPRSTSGNPLVVDEALKRVATLADRGGRGGHAAGLVGALIVGLDGGAVVRRPLDVPPRGDRSSRRPSLRKQLAFLDRRIPASGSSSRWLRHRVDHCRGLSMPSSSAASIDDAAGEAFDKAASLLLNLLIRSGSRSALPHPATWYGVRVPAIVPARRTRRVRLG